ncbi:MAG: hypothetical protein IPJ79_07980 [Bacteroidetes bacterium]|nr:hypothetical protein [Bacteroidota bacterium]
MHPDKFKHEMSYISFVLGLRLYQLSLKEIIWYSLPIYVPNFLSPEMMVVLEKEHTDLVENNKKIGFWFVMFLFSLLLAIVILYIEKYIFFL